MTRQNLLKSMDRHLHPIGYTRHSAIWDRSHLDYVDVVDVQWGAYEERFTINVGVCDPDIYTRCWGWPMVPPLFPAECTVQYRIGHLMGSRDHWWRLDDAGAFIEEFPRILSSYIEPFISRNHRSKGMIEELERKNVLAKGDAPEIVSYALLLHRTGESQRSKEVLVAYHAKSMGAWRIAVAELLRKMEL